jgi:hypothetical protein
MQMLKYRLYRGNLGYRIRFRTKTQNRDSGFKSAPLAMRQKPALIIMKKKYSTGQLIFELPVSDKNAANICLTPNDFARQQCCGSEYERIRNFWPDPNPNKNSDSDTDSDPDTII